MAKSKCLILLFAIMATANAWADGGLYVIRTNALTCDYFAYNLEQ